jgi:hypothetical protein
VGRLQLSSWFVQGSPPPHHGSERLAHTRNSGRRGRRIRLSVATSARRDRWPDVNSVSSPTPPCGTVTPGILVQAMINSTGQLAMASHRCPGVTAELKLASSRIGTFRRIANAFGVLPLRAPILTDIFSAQRRTTVSNPGEPRCQCRPVEMSARRHCGVSHA